MAAVVRITSSLSTVRLEATSTGNGAPTPGNPSPPPRVAARPLLSFPKPSWIVRTESNVRKESTRKPDPACVVCRGSGRVNCYFCNGKGRTNHIELAMLPKGEWPKWCRCCGGSGLGYCDRCNGTGEYRYIMGFHFMNKQDQDNPTNQTRRRKDSRSFSDRLLNDEQSDSGSES